MEVPDPRLVYIIIIIIIIISIYIARYHYEISNMLHALCQYLTNRKHFRQRLKESKVSVSSLRNAGRLFHAGKCPSASSRHWFRLSITMTILTGIIQMIRTF